MSKEKLNISELLKYFWSKKITIIILSTIFSISIVIYVMLLPNQYTSSALLAPVKKTEASNIPSSFSNLSSLIGNTNLSRIIGGSAVDDKEIFIGTLNSITFFEKFIDDQLLIYLFAVKEYDPKTKEIIIDPKIYDEENDLWVRKLSGPYFNLKPSVQEAHDEFHKKFTVSVNKQNFLVEVSYTHKSPVVAQFVVTKVVDSLNSYLREKTKEEADKSIKYLQEQIQSNTIIDVQDSLNLLVTQNIQSAMFAEVNKDFAYEYINYPIIPELKSGPSRALICIFGYLAFLIFLLLVLTFNYSRRR
tara:strand:+ start:1071 stop:1979 length:909 start_codon:yes stop_codon:yes gene_type:complete